MIIFPHFSPYIFKIGPIGPTWYGLMYAIGFTLGYLIAQKIAKKRPGWNEKQVSDLLTYMVLGVILGGRIGYVLFYAFDRFMDNPLYLFKIYDGGMSFHGGFIGVTIALLLFARSTKKCLLDVGDFVAPLAPIGLFFGRFGNLINGELWGRTTDLPWGIVFPNAGNLPRHPSQIYEALLEGLLLFIILWLYQKRNPLLGRLSGLFMVGYGLARFFVEFVREPDIQMGFIFDHWMTMGQILSLPMIIIGMYLLLRKSVTLSSVVVETTNNNANSKQEKLKKQQTRKQTK